MLDKVDKCPVETAGTEKAALEAARQNDNSNPTGVGVKRRTQIRFRFDDSTSSRTVKISPVGD